MKKEFHLVLAFDSGNEALMKTYEEIVILKGREIFASAVLAHGAIRDASTKPEIHLYCDDFIMGREEVEVKANEIAQGEPPRLVTNPTKEQLAAAVPAQEVAGDTELSKSVGGAGTNPVSGSAYGDEE